MTNPAAEAAAILDLTARIRAAAPVRLTSGDTVAVGQRVDESREGRSGVVVGIAGGYCTIVLRDGAMVRLPADMLTGGPGCWSARAEVAHSDEVALLEGLAAARKSADKRAAEAAETALAAEIEALKLAHPELEVGRYREHAAGWLTPTSTPTTSPSTSRTWRPRPRPARSRPRSRSTRPTPAWPSRSAPPPSARRPWV